jgi:hypothetical protein
MTEPKTLDELRDWFAARDGWTNDAVPDATGDWEWQKTLRTGDVDKRENHPYPATLDAAAGAMPEQWVWYKTYAEYSGVYNSVHPRGLGEAITAEVPDTRDEIHDRYLLAYRACCAMDQAKEKAQ